MGIIFYGFNVIFPAMIKAFGWARGDAAIAHSIRGLLVGFLAPVAALLINRYGSRLTILTGFTITCIGLLLLSTVISQLWQWIVLWGIVMSFGSAFSGYVAVQTNIAFWFNKYRAMAMGIALTGGSVGGFIAQPLFTWLIGKTNSWQTGWMAAGLFTVSALLASLFLKNKPSDFGQYADGIESNNASGETKKILTYRTSDIWTVREAVKTPAFWLLAAISIGVSMPIYLVLVHGVLHITDHGYTSMQAATSLGILAIAGGIARFPMGWLADRVEPRWIFAATFMGLFLALLGLWKIPSIQILYISSALYGFCYGAGLVCLPAIVANYFSPGAFASMNGALMPISIIFAAMVPAGGGYIADIYKSYDLAYIAVLAFIVIAFFCSLLASPPTKNSARK
jgi:MFS family permease